MAEPASRTATSTVHTEGDSDGFGRAEPERRPTVVVDGLHVVYRVYASSTEAGTAASALKRILFRQRRPATREVHAVRGLSFVAYEGDAIGVIGRNGSGKSTLMRAIAGLLPATRGAVYAHGQPSLLGVNAALITNLTGKRNVELGCLAMGMTPEQVRQVYPEIVEFSGIGEFINMPMHTYSSGMGARLRFAIAAAMSREVLLIDEALATGDREFRRRSEDRIRQMRAEAGTVFLVSHNMNTVRDTCNRVIWIDKGRIQMDGDAETVVDAYLAGRKK